MFLKAIIFTLDKEDHVAITPAPVLPSWRKASPKQQGDLPVWARRLALGRLKRNVTRMAGGTSHLRYIVPCCSPVINRTLSPTLVPLRLPRSTCHLCYRSCGLGRSTNKVRPGTMHIHVLLSSLETRLWTPHVHAIRAGFNITCPSDTAVGGPLGCRMYGV